VAQKHGVIRVIACVRRWALAIGVLVVAGAIAAGMPGARAATHSVDVTIVAGKLQTGGGSLDFNGYQRGGMTVTVPVGWAVVVHFENADAALPHSLAVLPTGGHQQVAPPDTPVFPGATTANFSTGLHKGDKQSFTFEASKAGTYEFVCGVQGHAVAGAWASLVVSATADAPSVTPAGGATISVK
jgi:sulfocyanin